MSLGFRVWVPGTGLRVLKAHRLCVSLNSRLESRKGVRLFGTVWKFGTNLLHNLYQIYHRNGPVSRTFEMRIRNSK